MIVNLKGRKPQQLQPGEVYCGRAIHLGGWHLPGSKWANPFKVGRHCTTLEECLQKYTVHILSSPHLLDSLEELRGKTLACWCVPQRCHCEVLLALLNT